MVEDTSVATETQPCQVSKSLQNLLNTGNEVQYIEPKGDTLTVKTQQNHDLLWPDAKRQKRRADEDLMIESKKLKQDEGESVLEDVGEEEVFDWNKYLKDTCSKYVPKHFFNHLVPECMCGFESGMKLEVPNPDYKNTYWLATIIARAPPLILVRYEGFQENNSADFWCNTLSDDIHPIGWCSRNQKQLRPPKSIQHKEKNWYAYLIKHLTGARKASESLFLKKSHPAHYLRAGQYVEVIDTYNPTCYWLARIMEVFSGRLFLQFESLDESKQEFWCYYTNENLRPVGYGLEHGLTLYPPKDAVPGSFKHSHFSRITDKLLALSKRTDASIFKSLFMGWQSKIEHNLYLGMKLEALHPNDPTSICVASVVRIFDSYFFLVKIDNLLSAQDDIVNNSFIAHQGSPHVFPIGFCSKNGLVLNQPRGYNGKFTWDAYLKYTKSLAAPEIFFQQKNENVSLLEVGMKLEAVDKENPVNICVCSITRIVNTHIWLNIDGDTRSDQVYHVHSTDIFPVGWCEATGHELQWPRPNTLEQKNRISSLRHNESRKKRLEVLRKGKLLKENLLSQEQPVKPSKRKSKDKIKRYGRRGVSRKRIVYDDNDDDNSITDTSVAIVCINRLAEEYNSEASIKEFFRLDSEGRLPKEVVTIDDDDDDESKKTVTDEKVPSKYTESDIDYFSFIRVKPKDLSASEDELFRIKMKENDGNQGQLHDPTLNSGVKPEKRSLSSVVAMLRATRRQGRSHLTQLEQYKHNKEKQKNPEQPSPGSLKTRRSDKENVDNKQVIDLCNDDDNETPTARNLNLLEQDGSIKIPGKGEYRIVEKIVTKHGDKNKIILKLGRPLVSNSETKKTHTVTSKPATMPTTRVDDMYTLQNMARSHPGVDEIMRNRFNKVRSFCKDLPKNPLQWSNRHVATFVKNADMAKHAKIFFDQEVDGHSFLLLTVQEIHHVLGVHLGPAMKLHDYIFTLQQLVNDAYITKHDIDGGSNLRETDSITIEKASNSGNALEICENNIKSFKARDENLHPCEKHANANVVRWLNDSVIPENLKREGKTEVTHEETSKIVIGDIKSLSVEADTPVENTKNLPYTTGLNSTGCSLTAQSYAISNQTTSMQPVKKPTSGYNFIPVSNINPPQQPGHRLSLSQQIRMIHFQPQTIPVGSEFPTQLSTQFVPVQYFATEQRKESGEGPTFIPSERFPASTSFSRFIVPQNAGVKRPGDVLYPVHIPVSTVEPLTVPAVDKKPKISPPSPKVQKVVSFEPPSSTHSLNGLLTTKTLNGSPYSDTFLANIQLELGSEELWGKFHDIGTEMILTRLGRRMFPNLQVRATGMDSKAKYAIVVDFIPADHYRYKYEYEVSKWMIACEETTPTPTHVYVHPESPATGEEWMRNNIDFTKCKLTNNVSDKKGHILMHSMHKYQPRINVIYWDGNLPLQINPIDLLRVACRREFLFEETKFIAVTAYQNSQITKLKIQSNPFARGFRGEWKKCSDAEKLKKRRKNYKAPEVEGDQDDSEGRLSDDEEGSDGNSQISYL